MSPQSEQDKSSLNKRQIEIKLLLFALVIIGFGFFLTFFGKLSTTAALPRFGIDINTANSLQLSKALGLSSSDGSAITAYRQGLPKHQFASTFGLRRYLAKRNIDAAWAWQQFSVRTLPEVEVNYWGSFLALIAAFILLHVLVRKLCPQADPFLLPLTSLLSGIGLMISFTVHDPYRDTFAFDSQALGVIIYGCFALLLPLLPLYGRLPLHRYTYAYAIAAILLFSALMVLGHGPGGTHIQLFGFEPIEFIKAFLVFFIAAYLADRHIYQRDRISSRSFLPSIRDTLPLIAIYVFALSLFGAVKDLGPAVLLFGTFVAMLYLVTGNVLYPAIGLILLLVAGYVGDKIGVGFFATRVEMWLHPWDNSNRLGGQLAQGLWGLGTGGVFGSGLGLGGPSAVPRAGSDMAFTTIGEETGLIGALFVLFLYAVMTYRGLMIARKAVGDFDRLLAAGLTILIGLQALVITGGATGVMPLTGITLPFVAYGTSSLVVNFFCIGVLMQISSKAAVSTVQPSTPAVFVTTSRRIGMVLCAGLLLIVGIGRLGWLQAIDDDSTATHTLRIPDADHVFRIHRNPRLVDYASNIVRGRILDRNGNILAENAPSGSGITEIANGIPRIYPFGSVGADIIYAAEQPESATNPIGADTVLRGFQSLNDLLPLYRRKDLPFPPKPTGSDVTLTIDIGVQKAAQDALAASAKKYGNGRGAAVVLNCKTGELLAAATLPTFNPSSLTEESWGAMHTSAVPGKPLLNRAFAGDYPPGSVFKLVTSTAAFREGKENLIFQCHHVLPQLRWQFDGRRYLRTNITDDEEFVPHNSTDMTKALRVSCNVYFAQLGVALGAPPLEQAITDYGLRDCPSLHLLGADLPDCAYGQGTVVVTPYQMARVCQTIGDGGVLRPSSFFRNYPPAGHPVRILNQWQADAIKAMMADVVTTGTAAGVFSGLSVAGKTGSAQIAVGRPHSWFVGFAPVDNPSIAFACVVENGGHGRTAAAPVCRSIVESILH